VAVHFTFSCDPSDSIRAAVAAGEVAIVDVGVTDEELICEIRIGGHGLTSPDRKLARKAGIQPKAQRDRSSRGK
jgi:hypothetical protein